MKQRHARREAGIQSHGVKIGYHPWYLDSGLHAGMTEFYKGCVDTSALRKEGRRIETIT